MLLRHAEVVVELMVRSICSRAPSLPAHQSHVLVHIPCWSKPQEERQSERSVAVRSFQLGVCPTSVPGGLVQCSETAVCARIRSVLNFYVTETLCGQVHGNAVRG
jgi:hypothetical protein